MTYDEYSIDRPEHSLIKAALALLFDMNKLFEAYVAENIKKSFCSARRRKSKKLFIARKIFKFKSSASTCSIC